MGKKSAASVSPVLHEADLGRLIQTYFAKRTDGQRSALAAVVSQLQSMYRIDLGRFDEGWNAMLDRVLRAIAEHVRVEP